MIRVTPGSPDGPRVFRPWISSPKVRRVMPSFPAASTSPWHQDVNESLGARGAGATGNSNAGWAEPDDPGPTTPLESAEPVTGPASSIGDGHARPTQTATRGM